MKTNIGGSNRCRSRLGAGVLLVAGLLMAAAVPMHAQSSAAKSKGGSDGELSDTVELGVFGGGSFFKQVNNGLGTKHVNGGVIGARVTGNFWRYLGLELSYSRSTNNLRFVTPPVIGWSSPSYGNRIDHLFLSPVIYFTPKGSKVRPFVTVGIGMANYRPTDKAESAAKNPPALYPYKAQALGSNLQVAMNYGGGLKVHLSDRIGLRFDLRGLMSRNPTYMLPTYQVAGLYIPRADKLHGMQATMGLTFYIGKKYVPPPPAPPPPPPPAPRKLQAISGGSISGADGLLCMGKAINFSVSGSDPEGRQLIYRWKVNGQPISGTASSASWTPDRAGDFTVEVEIVDSTDSSRTATAGPITVSIKEYRVPTATACSASPAAIEAGGTSSLSVTGAGSPCSTIRFKWTVSEGSVSGDTTASATFDSKSVAFEPNAKTQTKTVKAAATVTDDRGATASCSTDVRVTFTPKAVRFGDIIFAKNSARVNNCGKRILLEEVAQKAADDGYEIVLIGHVDKDEVPRRPRRGASLDEQRVDNVAAVLSGGTGTCGKVDAVRIKGDWIGTDPGSESQPGLCGESTKERSVSKVTSSDQNRRVEVWLVPRGTVVPAAVKSLKVIPAEILKKLGCPK